MSSKIINTQSLATRCKYLERKNASLQEVIALQEKHIQELREDAQLLSDYRADEAINRVWVWQSDGYDNSETMANDLPVLIRAYQLRELLLNGETIAEELQSDN